MNWTLKSDLVIFLGFPIISSSIAIIIIIIIIIIIVIVIIIIIVIVIVIIIIIAWSSNFHQFCCNYRTKVSKFKNSSIMVHL